MKAWALIPNAEGFREVVQVDVLERFDDLRTAFVRHYRNPNITQFVGYDFLASDAARLAVLVSRKLTPDEKAAFTKKAGAGVRKVAA